MTDRGLRLSFIVLLSIGIGQCDIGPISGYGPVNVGDLSPLTLNWNQVHYLVRENLLEIDQLRDVHDSLYKEFHECFGLESCLRQTHLEEPRTNEHVATSALLSSLRNEHRNLQGRVNFLQNNVQRLEEEQLLMHNRQPAIKGQSSSGLGYNFRTESSESRSYSSSISSSRNQERVFSSSRNVDVGSDNKNLFTSSNTYGFHSGRANQERDFSIDYENSQPQPNRG